MEEFDKIKAFSESVAERQANLSEQATVAEKPAETTDDNNLDFPQYLSQFRSELPEEKSESNLLMWALGGLGFVLLIGIAGFFYFYGPNDSVQEIVVIAPTSTPVKVRPDNPGGLQIAGTDKVVYNRTSAHKAEIAEKSFPEPEEPVLPPADQVVSAADMIDLTPVPEEVDAVPVVRQVEDITQPGVVHPLSLDQIPGSEVTESIFDTEEAVKPEEPKKAEPVKQVEEPKPEPVKPKSVEGKWRVQLLSSANKGKVESAWKEILKKHKALLSDMPYQIVSAQISGKGTFYRLQVGSFATQEQAAALCAKLKAKKQECIPTKQDK